MKIRGEKIAGVLPLFLSLVGLAFILYAIEGYFTAFELSCLSGGILLFSHSVALHAVSAMNKNMKILNNNLSLVNDNLSDIAHDVDNIAAQSE